MFLVLIFGIGYFLNSFLSGIYRVPIQKTSGDASFKWFFGITILINLALSILLSLLIALGGAFSTPKGEALINWYSLMVFTGLQTGLLWVSVLESWKWQDALWKKYLFILLATVVVFFSILAGLAGYAFLAVVLVAWIVQLIYVRSETGKRMDSLVSNDSV